MLDEWYGFCVNPESILAQTAFVSSDVAFFAATSPIQCG